MKCIVGFLVTFGSWLYAGEYIISLGELGSIHYIYEDKSLVYVDRVSLSGQRLYRHTYHSGHSDKKDLTHLSS